MNLQEYKTRYYAGNDRMNPALENKIKSKSTNLSKNPAFPNDFEELIAYKRFLDCVDKVKRYTGLNDLTSVPSFMMLQEKLEMALKKVVEIEKPHRQYLEKLGVKLVIDEMELPNNAFNFDAKIVDLGTIEHSKFQQESKEPTQNEIEIQFREQAKEEGITANEYFRLLKEKRRFVNMLIQGASKRGHYMFELVRRDLNKINPELADIYGIIMSINDYTYWIVPEKLVEQNYANPQITAGKEEIDNSEDTPKIITRGVYFPVSVHENIKGVMDIFGSHGLPDNEIEQQMVMNSTDTMYNEIWDIRIGAGVWEIFLKSYPNMVFEQGERYLQHYIFMRFCQLEPDELFKVAKLILAGDERGSKYIQKMVDDIIYDLKKEDLEGLGFKDGGKVEDIKVGYDVNDVVQLKNIPENYPYEIRNGIVDNKWKIVRVSKSGRSMYSDIMEDIFGYDIELLDTKIKYKAFVYPEQVKPYIKYADGGEVLNRIPKTYELELDYKVGQRFKEDIIGGTADCYITSIDFQVNEINGLPVVHPDSYRIEYKNTTYGSTNQSHFSFIKNLKKEKNKIKIQVPYSIGGGIFFENDRYKAERDGTKLINGKVDAFKVYYYGSRNDWFNYYTNINGKYYSVDSKDAYSSIDNYISRVSSGRFVEEKLKKFKEPIGGKLKVKLDYKIGQKIKIPVMGGFEQSEITSITIGVNAEDGKIVKNNHNSTISYKNVWGGNEDVTEIYANFEKEEYANKIENEVTIDVKALYLENYIVLHRYMEGAKLGVNNVRGYKLIINKDGIKTGYFDDDIEFEIFTSINDFKEKITSNDFTPEGEKFLNKGKYADGGDVRKMSWAESFRDKIPFEMVIVAKESEKDGGNEIVFNLMVQAQNDVTAYQEARREWDKEYQSSDLTIKKVYTKKEYDNLSK